MIRPDNQTSIDLAWWPGADKLPGKLQPDQRFTMLEKVVIWGASGHALVVADILKRVGGYEICGMLDDLHPERKNTKYAGFPILGGSKELDHLYAAGIRRLIFGFGDCRAKLKLAVSARKRGFEFATAIHPGAAVALGASIAPGVVVVAGAVVNARAVVEEHAIVNTCSSVGHECRIGRAAHIGPGARLGGRVVIEDGVWVGMGALIFPGVRIGTGSIVGAGSIVDREVPPGVVVYGSPAKLVRTVAEHYAKEPDKTR